MPAAIRSAIRAAAAWRAARTGSVPAQELADDLLPRGALARVEVDVVQSDPHHAD